MPGDKGNAGTPGFAGAKGDAGLDGLPGLPGNDGRPGITGKPDMLGVLMILSFHITALTFTLSKNLESSKELFWNIKILLFFW